MINTFSPSKKDYRNWAPFILRLAIGTGFLVHGWAKISRGSAGLEKLMNLINVPFPHVMSYVLPYLELFGGLAILSGFFVRLVSIPLIVTMLVAIFTIHYKYGFSSINTIGLNSDGPVFGPPGYEINVIYIAGLFALMITGAGIFSLDALLAGKKSRR
jgi:putative oxidoreductase